jgi:predicted nucleotidyltransferase
MNRIDPNTERTVRAFLAEIERRYDVAGVILYGSRARGAHDKDSDADVAVLLNGTRRDYWTVLGDMAAVEFDVMLETGILVSALPVWLDEWENPEKHSNPHLLYNIKREGMLV